MTTQASLFPGSFAVFSPDRVYRYTLHRRWADAPAMVVIGLNPSTADETQDDPTIRRCIGFAKRDGFGGLVMLNLFAFRSTAPEGLIGLADPYGKENDRYLRDVTAGAHVVAAWGSHKKLGELLTFRARVVRTVLSAYGVRLHCFGVNADGQPRHPLYLPGTTPIVPLEAA